MEDEIADAMVVTTDVLPVLRISEERAQGKSIDELVAARQRDRVFVREIDVREVERLGRRRDLQTNVVYRCGDDEVMFEAGGSRDDLLQVNALSVFGMFSEVMTKLNTSAPAMSMPIETLTRALVTSDW